MGRSQNQARRGKKAVQALPKPVKAGPGQLVSNYDGRANTGAGSYDRRADGSSEESGRVVEWKK